MTKKTSWKSLGLGLLTLALVFVPLSTLAQSTEVEGGELFDPLYEVYRYVQSHFYKADEIDDQEALYGAMKGLVEQLDDPYSEFLDPDAWDRFDENQGNLFRFFRLRPGYSQ